MSFVTIQRQLRLKEIIRFQLLAYCFLNGIEIGNGELESLTLLAELGVQPMHDFCKTVFHKKIYASAQTARNAMNRAEKKGLIVKEGRSRKRIFVHPDLQIQTEADTMIEYKFETTT